MECFRFKYSGRQDELLLKFIRPLLAEVSQSNNKQVAAMFSPELREDYACFNGFAKSYLVGEDCTFREWGLESKKSRVDLVWGQIDLRILK